MNRWLLIRRLRGPAFIILVGITALLNQWGVLSFARSWPLYLILAGLLMLAERAALAPASLPQSSAQPSAPETYSVVPASPSTEAISWSPVPADPPSPAREDKLPGGDGRA